MCEKLTAFLHSQDIVRICVSLAFRRHSQVRGRCWGLQKICKKCNNHCALYVR